MEINTLMPGDRLLITKGNVKHSGTYLGNGLLAHLSPTKGLCAEPYSDFTGDQVPEVIHNRGIDPGELFARWQQVLAQGTPWSLLTNCEHLSNFLETGHAYSPQLRGFVAASAAAGIIGHASGVKGWKLLGLSLFAGGLGMALAAPKTTAGVATS